MDAFEIQVYDATADAQRAIGLELHVNAWMRDPKENPPPPELPHGHQAHFTLEPSYGLFPWWELGGYFQTAITPDGSFDYAGVKLRSKFVTPPGFHPHLRLGLNIELANVPAEFESSEWGMEFRPIIAWENASWAFAFNPIIGVPLSGADFKAGPVFEPSLSAVYKFGERASIGFEYYASFGAISGFSDWSHQEHYLFQVVNLLAIENFELNLGFGVGLTDTSAPFVAKMILGYTWEHFVHKAR